MKTLFSILFILFLIPIFSCSDEEDSAPIPFQLQSKAYEFELIQLQNRLKDISSFEIAQRLGYTVDATGYRSGMGHHFVNTELVDQVFDVTQPEVLLFIPDEHGNMQCVGVEFLIPIEDITNPGNPPYGFRGDDDVWKIDTEFRMWTLHVWCTSQYVNNLGTFNPTNPNIP